MSTTKRTLPQIGSYWRDAHDKHILAHVDEVTSNCEDGDWIRYRPFHIVKNRTWVQQTTSIEEFLSKYTKVTSKDYPNDNIG